MKGIHYRLKRWEKIPEFAKEFRLGAGTKEESCQRAGEWVYRFMPLDESLRAAWRNVVY